VLWGDNGRGGVWTIQRGISDYHNSSTEQPRRVANLDRRGVSVESGYQRVWYLRTPASRGLFQNLGRLDPIFSGTKLIGLTNNRGSRFADITGIQILGVLKSEGEVGVAKFLDASRWPSGSDPLYKVFQNEPNAQRPAGQLCPPSKHPKKTSSTAV